MQQRAATLTAVAALFLLFGGASGLSFDVEAAKKRPVAKVVTLLKDMLAQLEKEAEEDEEIYDKMACWCQTNDKEKTKAIADAEARITDLTGAIESGSAQSARLNVEIKGLQAEVEKNIEALAKATALREKEMAEFHEEEKGAIDAVGALQAAIIVLSKHHPEPKDDGSVFLGIANMMSKQLSKHADILGEVITPNQKRMVRAFAQAPGTYFDAEPSLLQQSYAPRSGQIFGILKQMKETFEANLSDSQKEEMEKQKSYEEMKAAKEEEIALGQEQVQTKTEQLAETDEKLANNKQDLKDTRESLSTDEKFLMDLKVKCQMTDQEWEARQKARQEEMAAVSKAISVLTSDEAHDLFTKTFNPALLQLRAKRSLRKGRADQAAAVLRKFASRSSTQHSAGRLLTLAAMIGRAGSGLDAFSKVKKAIDDMVAQLLKQQADEVKKHDWCIEEGNENARTTEAAEYDRDGLAAKISDLEQTISDLTSAIEGLKAEIAEMQVQLKRAGEDRETENKEFQTTVADQRATQKLLQQALNVLKGFYDKSATKASAALAAVAASRKQFQPSPPGFAGGANVEKSAASGGVMRMIEGIMAEAKHLELDAIKSEKDAQGAYQELVTNTNQSIEEKNRDISAKQEEKAQMESDKQATTVAHQEVVTELGGLANEKLDLQGTCGFLLQNFEIRQAAREQEVEALRQAKAILSGAKMDGFLQRK